MTIAKTVLRANDRILKLPNGRTLGYADYGDPQGKPVIYNHGGLSCRVDVSFASDLLRDNHFRLIAIDRPGIGISSEHPKRSLTDWPDDVLHVANELDLDKFGVIGWSCGGPSALACAWKIPERLTGVATISGAPPLNDPKRVDELHSWVDRFLCRTCISAPWLAQAVVALGASQSRELIRKDLLREVNSAADRELIETMSLEESTDFFLESVKCGVKGQVDDYRVIVEPWGFELNEIRIPVNVYVGDRDGLLPQSHAKLLHESIAGSTLHIIKDRGHFMLHHEILCVMQTIT
jgi:pimeloyl-ACP methyl ester carboxylesterase